MGTYQINPIADYRNEGWTFTGASTTLAGTWSSVSDANYVSNPPNKGRAAVQFPQDISAANIPAGALIESVTLKVRAKKTDTVTRQLTVNVLSLDGTAYFASRSIALSQTATTYEVGTYTKDPLNRSWTKDNLNQFVAQVFTYDSGDLSGVVIVYEVFAIVNYRAMPGVDIITPTGTVGTAAPVVSFTYTQVNADIQASAQYKIFTAAQVQAVAFNPDTTPSAYPASSTYTVKSGDSLFAIAAKFYGNGLLWPTLYAASTLRSGNPDLIYPGETVTVPGVGNINGDVTSFTLPFALAPGDYFIYIKVTTTRGTVSAWASREFIVGTGATPGAPGGSVGGVGTGGGGGFETVIADGETANVFLTVRDGSNLLGVQQSSFETSTDSLDWVGSNATLSQDMTVAYGGGTASMKMAAASAATMSAVSGWVEVDEEAPLTVRAQVQAAATGRTVNVRLDFADDSFNSTGTQQVATITDVTTTFTEIVLTNVTSPVGTTHAQVTLEVVSPANGEVHNFDRIGLMYGVNAAYSDGGHASRNLLTSQQCNADDPITVEPWTAIGGTTYSRVATTGTGSDGSKAFKMLYAGVAPSISYVATGTAFTDTTSSSAYTLNKPAGVADGDVLVAYVSAESTGATGVCTQALAPAGWTLVDYTVNSYVSLSTLMRDGLAADPTTWTGNLTQGNTQVRKRAVVVAYRGAAPTASQWTDSENMSNGNSGALVAATPSVYNSDPGAWRLSAFAVQAPTSGGSMTANITAPTIPPIAYVGRATAGGGRDTSNSTYSFARPAGVQSGDLMIAILGCNGATVSAPSGWIKVREVGNTMTVMVRTAGASEPPGWTGSTTAGTDAPWVSQCVAYRNCDIASNQFIAENGAVNYTATFNTPTITNTNAKAWRISVFSTSTNGGSSFTSNEVSERADNTNGNSGLNATVGVYDSNGPVSTGTHQRYAVASNDQQVNWSDSWIGLIKPATSAGTPGANESKRQDATAGSSSSWLTLAAFDSNGVAPTGNATVYGTFTPGSGTVTTATAAFEGFLLPASSANSPVVPGETGATLAQYIELRNIPADVMALAGNQVTVCASFLGSSAGTPHLKLYAYQGVELLSTQVAEGSPFNTIIWTKSVAKFVIPHGTTRLSMGVSAVDRATSDYVLWDRAQVALGSADVYRVGTGSAAHPVYDAPLVEFAEDLGTGYGDWAALQGTGGAPFAYDGDTSLCSLLDQTMVPMSSRKYRARTRSYGLAGDTFLSPYGPESNEVTLYSRYWWLKDMTTPSLSMMLTLYMDASTGGASGGLTFTTVDTTTVFQPLGVDLPVTVTEGYKGDTFSPVIQVRSADFARLQLLLDQRHTLFLQSNIDKAWWVRPVGNLAASVQPTDDISIDPLRFVTVAFQEVAPGV